MSHFPSAGSGAPKPFRIEDFSFARHAARRPSGFLSGAARDPNRSLRFGAATPTAAVDLETMGVPSAGDALIHGTSGTSGGAPGDPMLGLGGAGPAPFESPSVDRSTATSANAASALEELVAPHLEAVNAALAPLLAVHGLSTLSTVDDVLAVEGLAEPVVSAAIDAVGSSGIGGVGEAVATASSGTFGGAPGGKFFGKLVTGGPCYPDAPGFEGYLPKCNDSLEIPPESSCLEDSRFLSASERLQSGRNFDRIPTSYDGPEGAGPQRDYRDLLTDSVNVVSAATLGKLYQCGGDLAPGSSTLSTLFAFWDGTRWITIGDDLLDLNFGMEVGGIVFGPVDLRAGILLHEHVHRVDTQQGFSRVEFGWEAGIGAGTRLCDTGEYNGAFVQAKYYGATDCTAELFARAYSRNNCTPKYSENQILLGIAGDLFSCGSSALAVIGLATVLAVTIGTAAALVALAQASPVLVIEALITAAIPSELAILLVWLLLA